VAAEAVVVDAAAVDVVVVIPIALLQWRILIDSDSDDNSRRGQPEGEEPEVYRQEHRIR
jgi:hypothetical protein